MRIGASILTRVVRLLSIKSILATMYSVQSVYVTPVSLHPCHTGEPHYRDFGLKNCFFSLQVATVHCTVLADVIVM